MAGCLKMLACVTFEAEGLPLYTTSDPEMPGVTRFCGHPCRNFAEQFGNRDHRFDAISLANELLHRSTAHYADL